MGRLFGAAGGLGHCGLPFRRRTAFATLRISTAPRSPRSLCSPVARWPRACRVTGAGDFDIVDTPGPGTAPYDYKLSFKSKANIDYDLATPTGRLEFARDALGARCPDPTIVKEQKVHLWTGLVSVDKYTADIKCHPAV